ncbi:OLC1v1022016C1 [Oldenlandia corymbosa var. corymbosa]|uniref:OLC1v1022016C1 n=1 Tax=Oldenlandia corymbosa var. corymbosa TaxID=529605 RepID=A0AAV1BWX8_OLDCO|nr:OLC1v1022016C1 [Oldenlandia corymbosa var. corymbosa]
MTKVVRDRVLKDANGNISDHLRNHIHLTNCIHLKNMHKHSPMLADKSLMRDLVVLQRSRSLRDPSTSPPSWHSPSVVDLLLKRSEKGPTIANARRSLGLERPRAVEGLTGDSPSFAGLSTAKVAPADVSRRTGGTVGVSDQSGKSGSRDRGRVKREESGGRNFDTNLMAEKDEHELPRNGSSFRLDNVSGSSGLRDKIVKQKMRHRQPVNVKTLSEQLNELPVDSDDAASSHIDAHARLSETERLSEDAEATIRHSIPSHSHRGKRRKFRGRKGRASVASRRAEAQSEMSVASNQFAAGLAQQKLHGADGNEEYVDQNVTRDPRNGCGIPWNWSRIHHRGKSLLDMAGRSLSCGLSDSRLKKGGPLPRGSEVSGMHMLSDHSCSSTKSDAEALPLLLDASGSQGSTENGAWFHDYSGELGIFADNLLRHDLDSDLASEARYGEQYRIREPRNGRHQNLTQKYMPRTFRDLVGQNLVAQALTNAVMKKKVGLLYVFYGPPGTGKTSTARIFSRALNCQSTEHLKPCGYCDSCEAHDMGKSRNIREIGPVTNFDFESIINLLDNMVVSQMPSQYRIFIFDDCDNLSADCWSAIAKVIDRAPRRLVFILVCSSLDVLPHIIISRCQKFFFPKLKDADIIYTLQWIASKEDLDIDKDALKLIASKSDGSLRDAEMTLEQLSLLGEKISVPLVQEMVGLISDEKLVDLLDLALSADTVNTVKNLREIMESGVEPLALMSQLATVITDILACGYDFTKEGPRRKFFKRQALSKEDMEKLRQALKTLSEAEKQLRMANDRLTWLTAALLQLAPDRQYVLPSSSGDTSFNHSPLVPNNANIRERPRRSSAEHTEIPKTDRVLSAQVRMENVQSTTSRDFDDGRRKGTNLDRRVVAGNTRAQHIHGHSSDKHKVNSGKSQGSFHSEIEEIWLDVLGRIQVNSIRQFLFQEGKLISVSLGAAPTVQLMFSSHLTKSKAEKFKGHILQAFESVLASPVIIDIRHVPDRDVRAGPIVLPASQDGKSLVELNPESSARNRIPGAGNETTGRRYRSTGGNGRPEIIELDTSPREAKLNERSEYDATDGRQKVESASTAGATTDGRQLGERNHSLSLVRGKVSLAHVIQQAEGSQYGWSKRKAVSIAEKLEQENLRLEPRSRSLLCWKASRVTRRKLSRVKVRARKSHTLLKFVSCGRCLSGR